MDAEGEGGALLEEPPLAIAASRTHALVECSEAACSVCARSMAPFACRSSKVFGSWGRLPTLLRRPPGTEGGTEGVYLDDLNTLEPELENNEEDVDGVGE